MATFGFADTGDTSKSSEEWVAALTSDEPTPVRTFPRPPACIHLPWDLRVEVDGVVVAAADHTIAVLETHHPPTYYLPPGSFTAGVLRPARGASYCEWKGQAEYYDVVVHGKAVGRAVWSYPTPSQRFKDLASWYALYVGRMTAVFLRGERVEPQAGGFYGGWITSHVRGPFKGDPDHPELV